MLDGALQAGVAAALGGRLPATGFSRGYLVSAGIMLLAVIIALFMIRIRHQELSGTGAEPMAPAGAANIGVRTGP